MNLNNTRCLPLFGFYRSRERNFAQVTLKIVECSTVEFQLDKREKGSTKTLSKSTSGVCIDSARKPDCQILSSVF